MDKSVFSARLAQRLEDKMMRQTELCQRTGINKATISQYLSGKYTAKHDRVVVLARALECNPLWLEGYDVDIEAGVGEESDEIIEVGSMLPVLRLTVDSGGAFARDQIEDREYAPREYRDKEYFYIRMPDESMSPLMHMGDLLLCESRGQLESGDIGLFVVDGSELCVKRYVRSRNGTVLESADRRWTPCFFPYSRSEPFRVEAKIIRCTHSFI